MADQPVSCRDLDPIGFLQAYFPANLIVNCEAECPMKWLRMARPFSEPNAYGGRATRDKKTRELRAPTAASGGLYRVLTDASTR